MTSQLKEKKQQSKKLPRFEQVFHRQHRYCDCAMPMVSKKWNEALGTFVVIRLCCLARAVEELTGKKLYEVYDFEPRWQWDAEAVERREDPDGSVEIVEKGMPPEWMVQRFDQKGIKIKHDKRGCRDGKSNRDAGPP